MQVVYEAENLIDAHLIKGLLEQHGIHGFVRGEHLVGALGELPMIGLIAVLVPDAERDAAQALIADWRAATPEADATPSDDGFLRA